MSNTGYSRVCLLSSGGMGEVEVAIRRGENSFERLYAIKRPHEKYNDDEAYLSMFKREGRIAGLIRHPNVVSVLDVGTDERGPYLVMDYVEGLALSRMLEVIEGKLPVQIALRIIRHVARGLQAAHELRNHEGTPLHIVHRDVSPQNILVGFNGSIHVTDFGIAKPLGEQSQTATGVVKGKLGYLAPELLRFEDVDQRADLFSLGVVMFEVLTSQRLYRGSKVPWRILHEVPPNVGDVRSELPQEASDLTMRLLAKHPNERPESARELVRALDEIIADLVTREGVHTLDEFALEALTDARDEHKRWLAEGLGALNEDADTSEFSEVEGFGEFAAATTVDTPEMDTRRSQPSFLPPDAPPPTAASRRVPLLIAGAIAAVLGLVLVVAQVSAPDEAPDASMATTTAPTVNAPESDRSQTPDLPEANTPEAQEAEAGLPVTPRVTIDVDTPESRPGRTKRPARMRATAMTRRTSPSSPLAWDEN